MKAKCIAAICAAGVLLGSSAAAQSKTRASGDDRDQKELYNYVLTMDKIQKIGTATKALSELGKRHPELQNESDNNKNLDELARNFQKYPEAVAILARNGMTPREYSVGILTLMQASIAVGFKKSGTYKEYPPEMLKLVSKANLAFVDQHFDEIKKLTDMGDR